MAAIQNVTVREEDQNESFLHAMQLVMGSVVPMTLQAANELGIFEVMAAEAIGARLSASEIVSKLDSSSKMTNPDAPVMVDRILRLLGSHSIVDCTLEDNGSHKQRKYGLNSVSKFFVKNENGVSLAPMIPLVHDKVYLDSWNELKNAVLEGGVPFNRVYGVHAFEYPGLNPKFNQVFNASMFNYSNMVIQQVVDSYKGFEHLNLVVDVGGGLGHTIKAVTSKHPHIKGINFDLPHVINEAPNIAGVENVAGDMFECVPQGDAILMKWVLHDWSDTHCLTLLKNCYKAIPVEGKVIVMDSVAPVMAETTPSSKLIAQMDVFMMTQTLGGKERTKDEFMALALGAGFQGIRFELYVCNFWVMEFYK
ncbi:Anthranilate N-methyltransferase [Linum grandiflorum]